MKLVLIAVLLQLCLSVLDVSAGAGGAAAGGEVGVVVQENQLQFGDLLVFPEELYHHYALYVDNQDVGQGPGQNIFHMTNPGGCLFTQFRGPFRRHNYLDQDIAQGRKPIQPQNQQQMIATIQRLRGNPDVCGTYKLATRNCEQIATKVRYGESHCIQEGAKFEPLARVLPKGTVHRREASAAA